MDRPSGVDPADLASLLRKGDERRARLKALRRENPVAFRVHVAGRAELSRELIARIQAEGNLATLSKTMARGRNARAEGRRKVASERQQEKLETFKRIWPEIAPIFGERGWRFEARRICGANGVAVSSRALDRLIYAARKAGVQIPGLRVKRRN